MSYLRFSASLILPAILLTTACAQSDRKQTPGEGPNGVPQATFLAHRLGTDHAEGITSMDMNGDGFPDLISGAYWYENPGAKGGEWKQHQFRKVGLLGEFVSDCG